MKASLLETIYRNTMERKKIPNNARPGNKNAYKGGNTPYGYWVDPFFQKVLDKVKDSLRSDDDFLLIVQGQEGAGKSVFAMQVAYYIDPTFNMDRVCFTPEQFLKAIYNAKKYECILFDESFRGLNWRSQATEISKLLHQVMMEMRQKNLALVMCIPSAIELSSYILFHRSNGLAHVYKHKGKRGYFACWGGDNKNLLMHKAKQRKTIGGCGIKMDFGGTFPNHYVVDEKEYRAKKLTSFNESIERALKKSDKNLKDEGEEDE